MTPGELAVSLLSTARVGPGRVLLLRVPPGTSHEALVGMNATLTAHGVTGTILLAVEEGQRLALENVDAERMAELGWRRTPSTPTRAVAVDAIVSALNSLAAGPPNLVGAVLVDTLHRMGWSIVSDAGPYRDAT